MSAADDTRVGVRVGDPAPPFRAPSSNGQTLDADSFHGKVPVALVFLADGRDPTGQVALAELDECLVEFGHRRWQLLVVLPSSPRELRAMSEEAQYAVTILADEAHAISHAFLGDDPPDHPVAVLVGADGAVVDVVEGDDAAGFADRVLERARGAPRSGAAR